LQINAIAVCIDDANATSMPHTASVSRISLSFGLMGGLLTLAMLLVGSFKYNTSNFFVKSARFKSNNQRYNSFHFPCGSFRAYVYQRKQSVTSYSDRY
jgi:hypothetical protein